MSEFLKRFGDYANAKGEAWRLLHPELMDAYQAAIEAPSPAKPVNFNQSALVRLTDEGRRILEARHEELRQRAPSIGPYIPKKPDENGRVSFQIWDLMNTFGSRMFLGNPNLPIESDIVFPASASERGTKA